MADDRTYSRAGTARALVLLASALAVAGAALLCVLTLVLGRFALATAVFLGFALVSAVIATLGSFRARSLKGVVGVGCGTLLVGLLTGLAIMLVLISSAAGKPT